MSIKATFFFFFLALEHYQNAHTLLLSNFGPIYDGTRLAEKDIDRVQGLIARDPSALERHRLTLAENLAISVERDNTGSGHPPTRIEPGRDRLTLPPALPSPPLALQGAAPLGSELRIGESSSKRSHNESHYYTSDRTAPYPRNSSHDVGPREYASGSYYVNGGSMLVPLRTTSAITPTKVTRSTYTYPPHISTGARAGNTSARPFNTSVYTSSTGYASMPHGPPVNINAETVYPPGYASDYYPAPMPTGAGAGNTAARSAYAPSAQARDTRVESAYASRREPDRSENNDDVFEITWKLM